MIKICYTLCVESSWANGYHTLLNFDAITWAVNKHSDFFVTNEHVCWKLLMHFVYIIKEMMSYLFSIAWPKKDMRVVFDQGAFQILFQADSF